MSALETTVVVAIVHYRSGGMLLDLLRDLNAQEGVRLDLHVVESGDDGTVTLAKREFPAITVHDPGKNVGYAAGNNIVFAATGGVNPILVVNPDVRIASPAVVGRLRAALLSDDGVASVAPVIRTGQGNIEYLGSKVELRRGLAEHTETHVSRWAGDEDWLDLEWLDGACLMFRAQALEEVGGFDERYFLFVEEVDWCLRARARGWRLRLVRDCEVTHQRSSSFGTSTKGAYYSFRNQYLLCLKHAPSSAWRLYWGLRVGRFMLRGTHMRSGHSAAAGQGAWHALLGRWGPAPVDRDGNFGTSSVKRRTEEGTRRRFGRRRLR